MNGNTSVRSSTALAPPGSTSMTAWEVLHFSELPVTAEEIADDNLYSPVRDVVLRWNELARRPISLWDLRLHLQRQGETSVEAVDSMLRELNEPVFGLRVNRGNL